jgi:hypothetical protein
MTRRLGAFGLLIALMATSAGAVAATSGGRTEAEATAGPAERTAPVAKQKPLRYEKHDLFIETNATDGDAGLQLNLDGEDWRWLKLRDPRGKLTLDLHEGPAAWVWPDRAVLRGQRAAVRRGSVQRVQEALPEGQLYVPRAHGRGPRAGRVRQPLAFGPGRAKGDVPDERRAGRSERLQGELGARDEPCRGQDRQLPGDREPGERELSMYGPPGVTSVTIPG